MHSKGIEAMDTIRPTRRTEDPDKPASPRWVPVAIAVLGIASVAAEIWGVVRGLSLMIAR